MVNNIDFSQFNLLQPSNHKEHTEAQINTTQPNDRPTVNGLVPKNPYDLDLKIQHPKLSLEDIQLTMLTGSASCTCNNTCEGCRQTDSGCYYSHNCNSTSVKCGHTDSC